MMLAPDCPSRRAPAVLTRMLALALAAAPLAGCGLIHPLSAEDRETRAACTADADRIYAARNRYQMSERDQTGVPYGGSTLPSNPAAGLSDQYEQDQLVDNCIARNGPDHEAGQQAAAPQPAAQK